MKIILQIIVLIAFFGVSSPVQAQTLLKPATQDLLTKLDYIVESKLVYRQEREHQLDIEKAKTNRLSGLEKQEALHRLFKSYVRYQTDSATVYLNQMAGTPPFDEKLKNLHLIGQAEIYAVTGSYAEAKNLLEKVNTSTLDDTLKLEFYHLNRTLFGWMANYAVQSDTKNKMMEMTDRYRDSILRYEPEGIGKDIVRTDSANIKNNPDLALQICLSDTSKAGFNDLPYIYYNLAVAYGLKGNTDQQIYYLAKTAIADIKKGTTEYEALPRLAQLCYEQQDIERAYRYLLCAMEDANFCKARLRTIEASNIFPIIDHAYKAIEKQRSLFSHILIYALCGLALLLVIIVLYLRSQMKRLSTTRHELALANERLKGVNENLIATDKAKEEYIARYLDRCRNYLDTLDAYRRSLLKRYKAHQLEEIYKELKSEETMEREQERFYEEFDNTFLNIYPNFVQEFNALLEPEAQIYPKGGEILNTELRIFALIRLGVTDSRRIAHFLNYSVTTIYSYRSKIRNKAKCEKADFEQKVMEI